MKSLTPGQKSLGSEGGVGEGEAGGRGGVLDEVAGC